MLRGPLVHSISMCIHSISHRGFFAISIHQPNFYGIQCFILRSLQLRTGGTDYPHLYSVKVPLFHLKSQPVWLSDFSLYHLLWLAEKSQRLLLFPGRCLALFLNSFIPLLSVQRSPYSPSASHSDYIHQFWFVCSSMFDEVSSLQLFIPKSLNNSPESVRCIFLHCFPAFGPIARPLSLQENFPFQFSI